jgi:AraC-like DNA-binding protein
MKTKEPLAFPFYESINDFLKTVTVLRTKNPLFYCLRLKGNAERDKYKPPFRKGFYTIILITNASNYQLFFDSKQLKKYKSFLVLQAPGLLSGYRYNIGVETKGYVIFFKPELFSFFKLSFEQEFSYFDMLQTNFFELDTLVSSELQSYFEEVFSAYAKDDDLPEQVAALKMLTLLYIIKKYTACLNKESEEKVLQGKENEVLFQNFLQLVSKFYLEKRSVKEYANLLSVTPNYLSQQVKKISDKSALFFINQKIINEAKAFILYSDSNISELSRQLNFTDTSNFVKFFKSQTGKTPLEFKKQPKEEVIYQMGTD